ncbi:hypothetical protein RTM1035_11315 [Roseovarius sp. TM1035]|uniref:hypothetical protein n=1 Tax=Roseovarius sp. TM1035 TaxID=391613 RepID=UPI0001556DC9|nr:hypothetical protein [Roseovarius sp. TM1035]AWZ22314.1 Hypothetical protein RAK1035_3609 [Roseovarius sp. AK1035]EDM30594.1 hypothetical protein RTM1035_11315 [Roseovarius sp. TM1035]
MLRDEGHHTLHVHGDAVDFIPGKRRAEDIGAYLESTGEAVDGVVTISAFSNALL